MAGESVLKNKLKQGYAAVFYEQWPALTGGLLLGLFSILIVAWSRPWGIVGGIRNWADWLFYGLGFYPVRPENPFLFSGSVMDIGFLLGTFGSALLAKEFAFRWAPTLEMIKGLAGGTLMGVGSALAIGCNVGAFYTPLINLSASGFPMMIGLIVGAFIGLKYLLWELEKFPSKAAFVPTAKSGEKGFDWKTVQPYLGVLVILGLVLWAYLYNSRAFTEIGGLLLFGAAFGIILQTVPFLLCPGLSGSLHDRGSRDRQGHRLEHHPGFPGCGRAQMDRCSPGEHLCHLGLLGRVPFRGNYFWDRHGDRRRLRQRDPLAGSRRAAQIVGRAPDLCHLQFLNHHLPPEHRLAPEIGPGYIPAGRIRLGRKPALHCRDPFVVVSCRKLERRNK